MSHLFPLPFPPRCLRFMRQHNHMTHHVGLHQHIPDRLRQHLSHDRDHESPLPFALPVLLRQRFMRQHNHLTHHVGLRQHILDSLRQR